MSAKAVQPQSLSPGAASTVPAGLAVAAAPKSRRFLFIDNLRILLISLVVVQHLSVTYGATGSWYYRDPVTDTFTGTFLMLWNAPGMATGMGLFFLIAAYFTPGSYDRKGGKAFLRDRFVRLGIPMVVYVLLVDALVGYIGNGLHGSYWSAYGSYLLQLRGVTGPVWFLAVLLVFSLLYAAWRELTKNRFRVTDRLKQLPSYSAILAFILALGMTTFVVRIWWPVTVMFTPLNVAIGYLPQYASMFVIGLIAYRGNWFFTLTPKMAKFWSLVAGVACLVFVGIAIPIVASGTGRSGTDPGTLVVGGFHWLAFTYAMWEPFVLVGASIGLLVLFRERMNRQGRLAKEAAADVYTVYLIHPLILVPFCYAFQPVALYPLLKFAVAVLITLPLCFLVSGCVRRIPILNRLL
ncbi:MAG TPA: acyltransferase family protein [Ktedonobacterales bacterium]